MDATSLNNSYVDGRFVLEDDDVVKIRARRFRFGTISGTISRYAIERDKIVERLDRAIERGHNLVWLNPEATIIAADPSTVDRSFKAELAVGDVIYVDSEYSDERGFYEIHPAPNDNLKLVRTDG